MEHILFENRFSGSKTYFAEMLKHQIYFSPRYLFSYAFLFLIFLFCLVVIVFFDHKSVIVWFGLVFPFVIYVRDYFRYRKNARVSYERAQELFQKHGNEVVVYVTNKELILGEPEEKDTKVFELINIAKLKTTKNFIILTTKAKNTLVLQKDGFIKGSADDFMEFMYEHGQGNKK